MSSEGVELVINSDEVISIPGSRISTFFTAANNLSGPGLNGGAIYIRTNFVTGYFEISLLGQNAGKNLQRPEKIKVYPDYYTPGMLDGISEVMSRQLVCTPGREEDDPEYCNYENVASIYATSGKNGLRGVRGATGFKGFNGGNSGIFNLTPKTSQVFVMDVEMIPGEGGVGGEGGEGGEGTPGGNISCKVYCHGVVAGAPGAKGLVGAAGENGKKGNVNYAEYVDLTNAFQGKLFINESRERK